MKSDAATNTGWAQRELDRIAAEVRTRRFTVTWLDKRDGKRHSRSYTRTASVEKRLTKLAAWPAFFVEVKVEDHGNR